MRDHQHEWPTVQTSAVPDPHLERDPVVIALEEEWLNGSLAEDEA